MEEREKNEYYLVSGCVAIAPYRREHTHTHTSTSIFFVSDRRE